MLSVLHIYIRALLQQSANTINVARNHAIKQFTCLVFTLRRHSIKPLGNRSADSLVKK